MEPEKTADKKPRKDFGHRIFILGLEVIAYFGIPAFAGVFIARRIMRTYEGSFPVMTVILVAAYLISWSIVIMRYRAIKRSHDAAKPEERHD